MRNFNEVLTLMLDAGRRERNNEGRDDYFVLRRAFRPQLLRNA